MIEIRRILCPIDFSDHSRRALDHAVAIARWYDSAVTVLHVFSTAPVAAYAPGAPDLQSIVLTREDRDQLLDHMTRFIAAESPPDVPVEPSIREGLPSTEILDHATAMDADLLVLGTHGRSGLDRLVLGSVAEKVLRKATCPVLTVPHNLPDAVPAAPVLFKHVLCPVDFSDCSLHALNYAMSLAQEADGQLIVMHTMYGLEDSPDLFDTVLTDDRLSLAEFRHRREEEIQQRLKDAVPETVAAYCQVETLVSRGKPGREILRIARERTSDLIVMGIHGRRAADLMFFGSTTQHVVRHAACPVLTLRKD